MKNLGEILNLINNLATCNNCCLLNMLKNKPKCFILNNSK